MKKVFLSIVCIFSLNGSQPAHYIAHKYNELLDQKIDNYIELAAQVERCNLCHPTFNHVRFLFFTHPCIIRCYNDLVRKQSVLPLYHLWEAYKSETISCDKNKFLYELCHLIGMVLEQFLIKLLAEVSDESGESLTELFDKINEQMPIDELIEVLETCYQKLTSIVQQVNSQEHVPKLQKRWVVAVLACLVVLQKLYKLFYVQRTKGVEQTKSVIAPQQG